MPTTKTKETTTKDKVAKKEKVKEVVATKEKVIVKDINVSNELVDIENFVFDTKKKYFEAVGRRKNATARVRLFTQNKKGIIVNGKNYQDYFKTETLQKIVTQPLEKLKCQEKFGFEIKVKGGGMSGQAGAIRHAVSRALISLNPYFRKRLKKSGYLTRDPRMRERKKPGLNRARRAPQWSKR